MTLGKIAFVGLLALSFAVGCGGEDDVDDGNTGGEGNGGAPSTGGSTGSGGGSIVEPPFEPEIAILPEVPGLASVVSLAGWPDEEPEFSWRFVSVPDDSGLDDDDLVGADSSEVSFVADRGGDYVLEVAATVGGVTEKKQVSVTSIAYDIPLVVAAVSDAAGSSQVPLVLKSDGSRTSEIGCPTEDPEATPETWASNVDLAGFLQRAQRPYFPADPSGEARLAWTILGTSTKEPIQLSSSLTRCGGDVEQVEITGVTYHNSAMPSRFSSDGTRLIVVNDGGGSGANDSLVTFRYDNTAKRVIKTWTGSTQFSHHAIWLDDTHVAWIEVDHRGTTGLGQENDDIRTISVAEDRNSPTIESLVTCVAGLTNGGLLKANQFDIVDDTIYSLFQNRIWRMERGGSGEFDCAPDAESNAALTDAAWTVDEFEISPDGETLVFVATVPDEAEEASSQGIYLLSLDDGEVRLLSPADGAEHDAPHWAVGGKQIVWGSTLYETLPTEADPTESFSSPAVTRVYRANADGTNVTILFEQEAPEREGARAQLGKNSGLACGVNPGAGQGLSLAAWSGVGLAALVLLRRRRVL